VSAGISIELIRHICLASFIKRISLEKCEANSLRQFVVLIVARNNASVFWTMIVLQGCRSRHLMVGWLIGGNIQSIMRESSVDLNR
jgi:hypothetical protein